MTAPPNGRCYIGWRTSPVGPGKVQRVDLPNCRSELHPRLDLANHSPDGFQWGYCGSGPAQLALALLADATGDDALALRTYRRFQMEIVTGMADQWQLEADNIAAFARSLDRQPEGMI